MVQAVRFNALQAVLLRSRALEALDAAAQLNEQIERRLGDDIRAVEEANAQINETNSRALALLESLTGEKLGAEPAAWQKWWAEQLGLSFNDRYADSKPTFTDAVDEPDIPVYAQVMSVTFMRVSCFAAGTMVQTMDGPRRIESISVGDRVLSQHTSTGAAFVSTRTGHDRAQWCRNVPHRHRRRDGCRDRHPPLLESRRRLDDGSRAETGRSPAEDRRCCNRSIDRARRDSERI